MQLELQFPARQNSVEELRLGLQASSLWNNIYWLVTPSLRFMVAGISLAKSWGSMRCGQNLDLKELSISADRRAALTRGFMIEQDDGCAQGQMSQG